MQEVDKELCRKSIPIPGREIAALGEVAKFFGTSLFGGPLSTGPVPGVYEGDSLSAHVFQWIQNRYGNRLKIEFKNGLSIILLRGDPWLVRFPIIYGEITVVCTRDITPPKQAFIACKSSEKFPVYELNILSCIRDLPQALANDLSENELCVILNLFSLGNHFLSKLNSFCKKDKLAMSALSDFNASAKYCMSGEYGLSRWSSLQTSENLLKYFITKSGDKFPHTHNLEQLAEIAYNYSLPKIDKKILENVQCNASIRYDEEVVEPKDAEAANHSAISIGVTVMDKLFPGRNVEFNVKWKV